MKKPTVSIIIPTLNEEAEIQPCILPLLQQIEPGDEIIVVDNGSTDKTIELAGQLDSKAVRLLQQPKTGTGYARRLGFDSANNEVLIRIDADSRALPGWLEHIKAVFSDEEVMSWSGFVGFRERTTGGFSAYIFNVSAFNINRLISRHNNLFGSNMAIRKSAWRKVRADVRDSMSYWEDLEIASALAEIGIDSVISKQILLDISYRGGKTSLGKFHHRMLGGVRTYWKRNKLASVLAAPLAYTAVIVVALWRMTGILNSR